MARRTQDYSEAKGRRKFPFRAAFAAISYCLLAPLLGGMLAVGSPDIVRAAPDPILMGPPAPDGPCYTGGSHADYVGGTDVNGNPVVSADAESPFHVRLQSETVRPELRSQNRAIRDTQVLVHVDGLAQAVNPPPACPPPPQH